MNNRTLLTGLTLTPIKPILIVREEIMAGAISLEWQLKFLRATEAEEFSFMFGHLGSSSIKSLEQCLNQKYLTSREIKQPTLTSVRLVIKQAPVLISTEFPTQLPTTSPTREKIAFKVVYLEITAKFITDQTIFINSDWKDPSLMSKHVYEAIKMSLGACCNHVMFLFSAV